MLNRRWGQELGVCVSAIRHIKYGIRKFGLHWYSKIVNNFPHLLLKIYGLKVPLHRKQKKEERYTIHISKWLLDEPSNLILYYNCKWLFKQFSPQSQVNYFWIASDDALTGGLVIFEVKNNTHEINHGSCFKVKNVTLSSKHCNR